jgi:hypothetical protein
MKLKSDFAATELSREEVFTEDLKGKTKGEKVSAFSQTRKDND